METHGKNTIQENAPEPTLLTIETIVKATRELVEQALARINAVEESVEIIAREFERQSEFWD